MTKHPPPRPPRWSPPPPPPPRGGLLGLWLGVAAIVVLVLSAGVTVVVLQPGDDDLPGAGKEVPDSPVSPSSLVASPSSMGQSDTEAAPSTTAPAEPSPAPPAAAPVTSDLDGDGLGDAVSVLRVGDDVTRLTLTSTGTSFAVERQPLTTYDDSTWADFDGDGRLDQVSWGYRLDGTLTLRSPDLGIQEQDQRLRLDPEQPYVTLKAGDFDGDGAPDLVAYGATSPRQVAVWVLRNEDGRFGAPVQWMRVPHATYATTTLLPGDFTGDGIADVVARVPQSLPRRGAVTRSGLSLLTSSGRGFAPAPLVRPTPLVDDADLVVGDFAGDGDPRLLLLGPGRRGLEVQALRGRGGQAPRDRRHDVAVDEQGTVVDAVTSDVDGNGVDDVVYSTAVRGRPGPFRVLQVRDQARPSNRRWARPPACPDRGCTLYFHNGY